MVLYFPITTSFLVDDDGHRIAIDQRAGPSILPTYPSRSPVVPDNSTGNALYDAVSDNHHNPYLCLRRNYEPYAVLNKDKAETNIKTCLTQ